MPIQMFDEMNASPEAVRAHYTQYAKWLAQQPEEVMQARRAEAEMIFRRVGITFAVYGAKDEDGAGTERLIPFDLIPRVIPAHEWKSMEAGLVQRVTALNRFIHDVYHGQEIIKAGHVPADQIFQNAQFRPEMMGVDVPGGVYSIISGIDIVRAPDAKGNGEYYVLEDNLRVPSGVSYMLEDRKMMMRLFPELFSPEPRGPRGPLPRFAAGNAARRQPGPRRPAHRGGADPRHVQQRLLRARLFGPANGHRTGRGPGPVRERQLCVHAHHTRPQARGRDLPPCGRRLSGPPGLPPHLHTGLCRLAGRVPQRQRDAVQRHRHRVWRTTSPSTPTCPR
jgi:hypothetical protein